MILRALEPEDSEIMYEAENDPAAWEYSDYTAPLSRELLKTYALTYDADPLRAGQLRLIAEEAGEAVGIVDLFNISARHLRAESGIYIFPEHRRKGLGAKALECTRDYCLGRLGLHQITATISEQNNAAICCYKKSGFIETGILRDWLRTQGGYEQAVTLSLIPNTQFK